MALLASYVTDLDRAKRLSLALRDHFLSVSCDSWAHLVRTTERHAVSVVVVDPHLASDADGLRTLRRSNSSLAIVAYVSLPPASELDLFEYGRLGLDALVVKDRNDSPRFLRATIERAEARGLLDPVRRALAEENPTVRDAVLMAISRAQGRLSADSMARAMGITRAHLATQLSQSGFPSPRELVVWGRLIVAGRMLEDARRSANAVAVALEFPSGSAFRNTCQRYLGCTPAEFRAHGGAAHALRSFFHLVGRQAPLMPVETDAELVLADAS